MQEFKMVNLSEIRPDPNQPRKNYDELAMVELVNSIREKGIIQPILIRPNGKGYMIVCGERRYRASKSVQSEFKDRNQIPAIIRDLSVEEAVDLQLIENLQRQDVHPLDEAFVFHAYEQKGKSVEEIALRVGKPVRFVRQRLVLSNLTQEWQKVLFHDHIDLKLAMKIAQLSVDAQNELYNDEVNESMVGTKGYKPNIYDGDVRRFSGELSNPPFDSSDTSLVPDMGSCLTCMHNTGAFNLFPEDGKPRCTNVKCFNQKSTASFDKRFEEAQAGNCVFIVGYGESGKKEVIAKKYGIEVFEVSRGYIESDPRDNIQIYDEWVKENMDGYNSSKELEEAWKNQQEEDQEQIASWIKNVEAGVFKPAFYVDGDNKGRFTHVDWKSYKRNNSSTSGSSGSKSKSKTTSDANTVTALDIQDAIDDIKNRQKRAAEIDENKIWEQVRPHFSPENNSKFFKHAALTDLEIKAIAETISKKLSYEARNTFNKIWYDKKGVLKPIVPGDLNIMLRFFMLAELPPTVVYSGFSRSTEAALSMEIAREYFPSVVDEIESDIKGRADKRAKNAEAKINSLKKQLAELKKAEKEAAEKKAAAKKPATKKGKGVKSLVDPED